MISCRALTRKHSSFAERELLAKIPQVMMWPGNGQNTVAKQLENTVITLKLAKKTRLTMYLSGVCCKETQGELRDTEPSGPPAAPHRCFSKLKKKNI